MKREEILESIIKTSSIGIANFDFGALYPNNIRRIYFRKWRLKDKISKIIDKL